MLHWIQRLSVLVTAVVAFAIVSAPGCTTTSKDKDKVAKDKGKDKDKDKDAKDHDHESGPHGGPVAEWGSDDYHAEFTVDHGTKTSTIYLLDDKAKKAPNVEASRFSKVKLVVKNEKSVIIDFEHDAKKSGPDGIAFVATNDFFAKAEKFEGEIHGILDKGEKARPYNGKFEYDPKKKDEKKK